LCGEGIARIGHEPQTPNATALPYVLAGPEMFPLLHYSRKFNAIHILLMGVLEQKNTLGLRFVNRQELADVVPNRSGIRAVVILEVGNLTIFRIEYLRIRPQNEKTPTFFSRHGMQHPALRGQQLRENNFVAESPIVFFGAALVNRSIVVDRRAVLHCGQAQEGRLLGEILSKVVFLSFRRCYF